MLQRQQHRLRRKASARALARFVLSLGLAFSLVVVAVGGGAERAAASASDEQLFVQLINDLRSAKGLEPLASHPELTAEARSWTNHMAATDRLAHSPDMSSGISAQWSVLGENVGMHGVNDVSELFQAFVNSPAHYQNLVDARFNYIGVGVASTGEGKLWTTHRFMAAPAPTPPTTQAPPPTTIAPAPTTTVPPTTAPPTTAAPIPTTAPPTTVTPETTPATEPAIGPTTPSTPPASTPATAPQPEPIPDPTVVDDPTAGPSEPDVPTVEQVLVELAEAGI